MGEWIYIRIKLVIVWYLDRSVNNKSIFSAFMRVLWNGTLCAMEISKFYFEDYI